MSDMHQETWITPEPLSTPTGGGHSEGPLREIRGSDSRATSSFTSVPNGRGTTRKGPGLTENMGGPVSGSTDGSQDHVLQLAVTQTKGPETAKPALWNDAQFESSASTALLLLDGDGRIQGINDAVESLTGYRGSELRDAPLELLIADAHREPVVTWFGHLLAADASAAGTFPDDLFGRRRNGSTYYLQLRCVSAKSLDEGGIYAELRDVTRERHREIDHAVSTRLLSLLNESVDADSVLDRVAPAMVPRFADMVALTCYPHGRPPIVAVAHPDSERVIAIREGCVDAIRQWNLIGDPALERRYPSSDDDEDGCEPFEQTPGLVAVIEARLAEAGLHSIVRVPIDADGSRSDSMWFAMERPDRQFLVSDVKLAADLAHRCELFLRNALAIEDERRARQVAERTRRRIVDIHSVAAALSNAALPDEVAEVIVTHGARLLGTNGVAVSRLSADGRSLELLRAAGFTANVADRWARQPLALRSPMTIAANTLRPVWLRNPTEVERRYQDLADLAPETAACAALPLIGNDRCVGVLFLSYPAAKAFDGDEQSLIAGVAQRLAEALDRAGRYEAERTARHDAEHLAALRTATLDHVADGIVVADRRGQITFANAAARKLLGVLDSRGSSQDEWYGAPLLRRRDGVTKSVRSLLEDAALRGEATEALDWTVVRGGRIAAIVEALAAPIVDDERRRLGAVLTLRDVTADRELDRQKNDLFADLAHDLRTPLAAIKASIGVVLANEPEDTPEPLHRLLSNIDVATDRLTALVPNLIELARLQAGREPIRGIATDLRTVAARAARTIESLARARNQSLSVYLPPDEVMVRVDPIQIERALLNLLGNAQKYGREGGRLTLRLDVAPTQVVMSVSDDGRGISAEDQKRIFDRYEQADPPEGAAPKGFGLGLAITRAIAEAHGGRVAVESAPERGTTFRLHLPLDACHGTKEVAQ